MSLGPSHCVTSISLEGACTPSGTALDESLKGPAVRGKGDCLHQPQGLQRQTRVYSHPGQPLSSAPGRAGKPGTKATLPFPPWGLGAAKCTLSRSCLPLGPHPGANCSAPLIATDGSGTPSRHWEQRRTSGQPPRARQAGRQGSSPRPPLHGDWQGGCFI